MVPVCDKRYHIYNRFRHFWAEIKKLWNYPLGPAIDVGIVNESSVVELFCKLFGVM